MATTDEQGQVMDTASAGGARSRRKRDVRTKQQVGRTRWIGETSIRGVFAGHVKEHFAVRLHDASDVRVLKDAFDA